MNVADAGVVVELDAGDLDPRHLGDDLGAAHLVDSEATSALRRLVLHGSH